VQTAHLHLTVLILFQAVMPPIVMLVVEVVPVVGFTQVAMFPEMDLLVVLVDLIL
jgi:hypothetical protein